MSFYRSTPRSVNPTSVSSNSQYEKKLDKILDAVTRQSNKMTSIEEKGRQTLASVENLDKRLEALENKVNDMEQLVSQENSSQMKKHNRVPPELSVKLPCDNYCMHTYDVDILMHL